MGQKQAWPRKGSARLWREVRRPGDSPPSFQQLPTDRPLHASQAHVKEYRVPGLGHASALQQARMPVHTGAHAHACAHTHMYTHSKTNGHTLP